MFGRTSALYHLQQARAAERIAPTAEKPQGPATVAAEPHAEGSALPQVAGVAAAVMLIGFAVMWVAG